MKQARPEDFRTPATPVPEESHHEPQEEEEEGLGRTVADCRADFYSLAFPERCSKTRKSQSR